MAVSRLYSMARMTVASAPGTGTISLGVAVASFLTFALAGVSNGETVAYTIEDGAEREVGFGVYTSAGLTLTRNVRDSTNGGAAINASANAEVFITPAAEDLPWWVDGTVYSFIGTAAVPLTNDGAALGSTTNRWSDLFLADGGVINFNGHTITHSSGLLTINDDLTVTQGTAGATTAFTTANSDNTNAASNSNIIISTGGASGGDPLINWNISGTTNYYMGLDNSVSDRLMISTSSALASPIATFTSTPRVGINQPDPEALVHVSASANSAVQSVILMENDSASTLWWLGPQRSGAGTSFMIGDGAPADTGNLHISTAGAVAFPNISTTASAANAFLDSGASNNLLRSTSSIKYKKNMKPIVVAEAESILKGLRPFVYNSTAQADDPTREFFGLGAEDVAAIDTRLVHFDADGQPDSVQYERVNLLMIPVVQSLLERVKILEGRAVP